MLRGMSPRGHGGHPGVPPGDLTAVTARQSKAPRPARCGRPARTRITSTRTQLAMPTGRYSPTAPPALVPRVPACCPHALPVPAHPVPLPAQTQLMFKWAEPKICNEELPQAAQLPPSGVKTKCPPCNPGFFKSNSSACEPCPYGSYSNGSGKEVPGAVPWGVWAPSHLGGAVGAAPLQGCSRCPQAASAARPAPSRCWGWSTSGGTCCPPTWRPPCSAASTSSTRGWQVLVGAVPSPSPRAAGNLAESSPRPCRLGGGWGLHLHGSRSLRQRLHDPHTGGAWLQVSTSPRGRWHCCGAGSGPHCPLHPQSPTAGAGGWGQQGGGQDHLCV